MNKKTKLTAKRVKFHFINGSGHIAVAINQKECGTE